MPEERLNYLFQKYLNNSCSREELKELLTLAERSDMEPHILSSLRHLWNNIPTDKSHTEEEWEHIYHSFMKSVNNNSSTEVSNERHQFSYHTLRKKKKTRSYNKAAAAAIFILLSIGTYFFYNKKDIQLKSVQNKPAQDILPGGNKAILTLSDGFKIILNDVKTGELAKQAGISVIKTHEGQLIYTITDAGSTADNGEVLYNTIETPRGGKYQVNLPDGSKVWLNAASSLIYPTQFEGNERKVEVSGEAYFEVTPNKTMPFRVASRNQIIEVLGTHFNVNAYTDEPVIRTTLLEGLVSIKPDRATGLENKVLKPGQESLLGENGIKIQEADIEAVIAWKNGDFIFKEESLASIMRKVSKWYDVDVSYEKGINEKLIFSGLVSRSRNISAILSNMELTGKVHFKIEGRRIIIMP
jgi:transmembrane sensor